jgi:hypothetical protein
MPVLSLSTRLIIFAAALCCAALLFWWRPAGDDAILEASSSRVASPAPERSEPPASTAPEAPDAMSDAATYAAVQLRQIKAVPEAWNDVWKWRQEFSAATTPALRREVVALAREIGPEAFLAVLPQALASEDDWLRLDAARSIALLPEARLRDGVTIGVAAPDAAIRGEVMDVVAQAPAALHASLLERTLASANSDVVGRSIELLCEQPSPELFTVLIEGLRSDDPSMRTAVGDAISTIVSERFHDYAAIARWWAENRDRFDGSMLRLR